MANYIGNQPSYGEFKRLDSISSSFNGSTTTFNLTYNSVSTPVGDASQLIVSLNGIIQEPLNSYTLGVGGSSIVFSSAPASGDQCFIMYIGGAGGTVTTISDGSVTASKLDASLKDYYEDEFTANGSTTDFTLSRESIGVNQLLVTIDGIVQPTSAYTASGTTLTISPALPNGTNIRVVHMGAKAGVFVPQSGSVGLNELDLVGVDTRYYTQTAADATFETISNVTSGLALKAPIANPSFTGNVGIGTSSPAKKLEISGSTGVAARITQTTSASDTYSQLEFYDSVLSSTQAYIRTLRQGATVQSSIAFATKDSSTLAERLRITSTGNVGIGTNSPSAKLQIAKSSDSASPSRTLSDYSILFTAAQTNTYNNGIGVTEGEYVSAAITPIDTGSGGAQGWAFVTGNNTAIAEAMRIDSSGNVGIGTNSPSSRLHTYTSSGGNKLIVEAGAASQQAVVSLMTNATTPGQCQIYMGKSSASTNGQVGYDPNSDFMYFYTSNSERMRIDSEGRVTMPYQPVFHAAQRTSQASGIILSFQIAHVNVGGHFNGTRFTCPIAGKYKFYYAALFGNDSTVGRWWLLKNGSYAYGENSGDGVQLRIDNSDGHGYPYGERTIIVSANANDYFEIYFSSDTGTNNNSSPGYNTFGGYLIS